MEIVFSSAGSYDPDGTIAGYRWDFGDGSAASTDPNPTHTYTAEQTYVATLTVTDALGATRSAQVSATVPNVANRPPVAVGSATPAEGSAPLVVQFSSAGSTDPDDGIIAAYLWNFGDGITSTEANPKHTYAALGNFAATLTVTDRSGATATTTVPVATWQAEILNAAHGRCADLDRSNTSNGTWVLSFPCTGLQNQRWVLESNGRITNGLSATKCLTGLGAAAVGANVGIGDCNGALNQRWAQVGNTLVNDSNGLCMTAKDGSVVPATPLVLTTCSAGDASQQWKIAKWQERPEQRLRNTGVDRCVAVAGGGLSNGRAVADWACTDDATMAWYLDPSGLMINRAGETWCMDGDGGTLGKQVVVRQCGQNQSWQRWQVSGGQLVNATNNLCLTRSSTNDVPGSNMALAACDSANPNQQFAMEASGQWAWQQLRNPVTNVCAGVTNTNNGTWLQTKPCDPNDAGQSWYLDGGGRLQHKWAQGLGGRCVDGNGGTAGANVLVYDCNTQPWQHWIADAGAQTLVNDANDLCVETSGSALKLQACSGVAAQKWIVETR